MSTPEEIENELNYLVELAERRGAITALRKAARELEWFGAQGNTPSPDTSWQGVLSCIGALESLASGLESLQQDKCDHDWVESYGEVKGFAVCANCHKQRDAGI